MGRKEVTDSRSATRQFLGNSENEVRVSTELAGEGDGTGVPFPRRASDSDVTLKLPITGQLKSLRQGRASITLTYNYPNIVQKRRGSFRTPIS